MRKALLVGTAAVLVAACSDNSVTPTDPLQSAPTIQLSHVGGDPAVDDLCEGLSPCDAYDYDRDGNGSPDGLTGTPGICFLPPTVDNHLSDPACSAPFVPGLDGAFQLAWCQVAYPGNDGSVPPSIVRCQDPSEWQDVVQDPNGGEFYVAPVRWRRSEADVGDVFRLYLVRGDLHYAHRDVVIDPNLTTPADGFVHAIGYGNEPIKIRISESLSCVYFDTQAAGTDNAATCLIAGATSFSFQTSQVTTTFNFPDGNPTFLADFEVSECLSLGFYSDGVGGVTGNALVDTPLADCKISLSSEELDYLPNYPAEIHVTVNDPRWVGASPVFGNARLNVLQYDEYGLGALPPSTDPGWFGDATSSNVIFRALDWGLDKLVSFFGPQPLAAYPGAAFDFTRMSDFQVAVMPVMEHDVSGATCASGEPSCLDMGTFSGTSPVPVRVHATAPSRTAGSFFDASDTRLHYFPESGTVACPAAPVVGEQCYAAGDPDNSTTPPSIWDHVVVVTGPSGRGTVDWALAAGDNRLHVAACGVARPGSNEPNPPGEPGSDHVWGSLGECTDRFASMTEAGAYDNGPADGFTPFEPVDVMNEVAVYGLPLTFEARTCPQIQVDGIKSDAFGTAEWEECAEKTGFIAPLKGKKPTEDNAWLYTYDDGSTLYVGLEVANDELGNRIFIQVAEAIAANGNGVEAAGDDILLIDFGDPSVPTDWHLTESCLGNNSSSLCGSPDVLSDGSAYAASAQAGLGGAGQGRVFYEFSRPLGSPNGEAGPSKEDLLAISGQSLGLRVQVTQGQGGGKGGFVYPDPQTSPVTHHEFRLQ